MSSTLSEQLREVRPALTRGKPEVRAICQVTAKLAGPDARQSFHKARATILNWLRDSQNIHAIPDSGWHGDRFEIDSTEGRPVFVETLDGFWAMRYDNPDASIPGRAWRTEAILGLEGEAALVGLRLSVISREWGAQYFRSVPNVVRSLVSEPGLEDHGFRLSGESVPVTTADDVRVLVQLLESEGRTRPVFVISENENGEFEIDPSHLAMRTAGIAHVVTIGNRATWLLKNEIGDSLSVYGGAVRTYAKGFDRFSARFRDHRLALPDWIRRRFDDPESFVGLLSRHAIDASVDLPDLEDRLPSFAFFRRIASEQRLAKAKASDSTQAELMALYEAENDTLQSELDAALQMAEESEEKASLYRRGQEELETVVFGLKQRIVSLQTALTVAGKEEAVKIPASLAEIDQWVPEYVGDGVYLLGRAIRGARKSVYDDTELVYRSLLLLGNTYRNYRLGLATQDELQERCGELGVEITGTGDRATLMQWRDQYEVDWARGRRFLDTHLKKGAAHDPRVCLRIYFFWDDDIEQVVIGYMTDHLQSSRS